VADTTPVSEVSSEESKRHVAAVEAGLSQLGIAVRRAPRLVRGLDYYLRTVFEVISPELGEDTVICGGGRYDRLISDLGGSQVPGTGFAIGEDRLIEVLPEAFRHTVMEARPIAILPLDEGSSAAAMALAREWAVRGVEARVEVTGRSLKAGLKWAGKISARAAVIIGEREREEGSAVVRYLDRGEQETVDMADVVDRLSEPARSHR
jgi:histidyl-tRNA synthetase